MPVRIRELDALYNKEWDLTFRQIIPFINGHNYTKRIATEADVDLQVVEECLQHLLYHGHIQMIDIFQYSNTYMVTPKISELASNLQLQRQCEQYVTLEGKQAPPFNEIFKLYCGMRPNVRMNEFCNQRNTRELGVDDRRLVIFGVVHGLLRRIHHYPVCTRSLTPKDTGGDRRTEHILDWMNGSKCFDEICCEFSRSSAEIDSIMRRLKSLGHQCVIIAK